MHELSIALSIVEMAEEESERRGNARIRAVHLRVGRLSGVVKESLISSYEIACESTTLEGSRLVIEEVPVAVFCPRCDELKSVHSIQWFHCPTCGMPTPQIVHGKELEVVALEVEP